MTVRLGGEQRTFTIEPETQGGMIALDLVPVAVAGGTMTLFLGLQQTHGGGSCGWGLAIVALSASPLVADAATGAIYRLDPSEVMVVFE